MLMFLKPARDFIAVREAISALLRSIVVPPVARDRMRSAIRSLATERIIKGDAPSSIAMHNYSNTVIGEVLVSLRARTVSPVFSSMPIHSLRKPTPPTARLQSSEYLIPNISVLSLCLIRNPKRGNLIEFQQFGALSHLNKLDGFMS